MDLVLHAEVKYCLSVLSRVPFVSVQALYVLGFLEQNSANDHNSRNNNSS